MLGCFLELVFVPLWKKPKHRFSSFNFDKTQMYKLKLAFKWHAVERASEKDILALRCCIFFQSCL